jgi:hypothetical protein
MFRPIMLQIMLHLSSSGAFLYHVDGLNVLFSISLRNCYRSSHYVTNQQKHFNKIHFIIYYYLTTYVGRFCDHFHGVKQEYAGADKSLSWPRRKQVIATEDFDVHVSYL